MLKLTVAVLAVVLAGTASAAGWRSLRIDASSDASFKSSLEAFEEKLSPVRRYVLVMALHDIWDQGTKAAAAEEREFEDSEYLRQLDGLGYAQIVKFTDPTGETAQMRYRAAKRDAAVNRQASSRMPTVAPVPRSSPWPVNTSRPPNGYGTGPGSSFDPGGPQGR